MNLNLIFSSFFPSKLLKMIFFFLLSSGLIFCLVSFWILLSLDKPEQTQSLGNQKYNDLRTHDLDVLELKTSHRDFPYEAVVHGLELKGIQSHKVNHVPSALIHLKRANRDMEIQHKVPLSVYFDENGCMQLDVLEIQSPIKITPFIYEHEVVMSLEDKFNRNKEKVEEGSLEFKLMPTSDPHVINQLKEEFRFLKVKVPDLFTSLYQEKQLFMELSLDGEKIYLKDGDVVGYANHKFSPEFVSGMISLRVKKPTSNRVQVECTDASGYYTYILTQDLKPKEKVPIPQVEEPKQVVIRGTDQISCLFQGKRQLIKKGDFFYLENSKWKKIISLTEFDSLLENKIYSEIFVIEDIFIQNRIVFLSGKVFDKSRWNFSSVNWKFDLNKKKNTKDPAVKKSPSVPQEEINENSDKDEEAF